MTSFRERCQNEATALRLNELCRLKDEEITTLRARVQELEKDAARYRWLRNMDHWPATFDSHSAPEPIRGPELDAAIDAAMQKGEK